MKPGKVNAVRRKRLAPRLSPKAVAPPPIEEPQELPLDLFMEEEELGTPMDDTVEPEAQWTGMEVQGEEIDDLVSDASGLQELREGENDLDDDGAASGVDNPVLLYLQEAGTVPLLKPEDEVRIAKQIVMLKARFRKVVQE